MRTHTRARGREAEDDPETYPTLELRQRRLLRVGEGDKGSAFARLPASTRARLLLRSLFRGGVCRCGNGSRRKVRVCVTCVGCVVATENARVNESRWLCQCLVGVARALLGRRRRSPLPPTPAQIPPAKIKHGLPIIIIPLPPARHPVRGGGRRSRRSARPSLVAIAKAGACLRGARRATVTSIRDSAAAAAAAAAAPAPGLCADRLGRAAPP